MYIRKLLAQIRIKITPVYVCNILYVHKHLTVYMTLIA